MRLWIVAVLTMALVATACSSDGSTIFGEHAQPCPATVLANEVNDSLKIETGSNCLMTEVEAGRSVIWDVLLLTVEGDPIPTRYDFDGQSVTITTDSSRDEFGSGGVSALRCESLRRTQHLPEGVDCTSTSGSGFASNSLPGR